MAESVSDGDTQVEKPASKRRRILDRSAVVPVSVYSNKVSSSLQLKPAATLFTEIQNTDDDVDESLWAEFSPRLRRPSVVTLSDSEDEAEPFENKSVKHVEDLRSPSPPPPESPVQKQSRKVTKKIKEVNRTLQAMTSIISPEPQNTRSRRCRSLPSPPPSPPLPGPDQEDGDDDVIILTPNSQGQLYSSDPVREIPLKIRCRTDIHKIPVLLSTPLSDVVSQLSVILKIPPPCLLLLKDEIELPTDSTIRELGLGIADIIECVVMATEDKNSSGNITLKLQSKDRESSQEFSIHREAPLGSIFSQYLSNIPANLQGKVRFHFDGSKVTSSQTPAQLDMEDADIIEVWI